MPAFINLILKQKKVLYYHGRVLFFDY